MTPDDLVEIELIKQLKAKYFRLMDQKRWDAFSELFTENCEQSWQAAPDQPIGGGNGREGVVSFIRESLAGMRSTHHGHMPEIELTSPTTAVGIWALYDHCTAEGEMIFDGAGYYRDDYEKVDGRWLIRSTRLEAEGF
ncbi:MAG: nuclear transport factor 2 family protein [bacterium]|nr:nuclear transport factor 2 family protein [bacterium]